MTYLYRFLIAAPLAWLSAGYLLQAVYWVFWNLIGVRRIPWDERGDTALLWLCGFIVLATLIRELPNLPRLALAAAAAYFGTPYLLEGLFWTFDTEGPPPGVFLAYLHFVFGLLIFAIAKSWLRRVPPLTFLL